jgi:hypothetical protein
MLRKLAAFVVAGVVAGGLVVGSLAPTPAEATHTLGHLRRQISRLENQVSTLQNQVRNLNHDVFTCEFLDTSTPTTFSDGSTGYPLYSDAACGFS